MVLICTQDVKNTMENLLRIISGNLREQEIVVLFQISLSNFQKSIYKIDI